MPTFPKLSGRRRRVITAAGAVVVIGAIAAIGGVTATNSPAPAPKAFAATQVTPSEYVARMYTEGLGRIPDQRGWDGMMYRFKTGGCDAAVMKGVATTVLASSEFTSLPYSDKARAAALFRSMISREPTADEIALWSARIAQGGMRTAVETMAATKSFAAIVDLACTGKILPLTGTPYSLGATHMTSSAVQELINKAAPGSTVSVPQATFVRVDKTIVVKRGVTLTTAGSSGLAGRYAYLNMARFARSSGMSRGPVITVLPGATVRNVWVDGLKWANMDAQKLSSGHNVTIAPTATQPSTLRYVRSDNGRAAQNIMAFDWRKFDVLPPYDTYSTTPGDKADLDCSARVEIANNLVINSANLSTSADLWTDGIATGCGNSLVNENEILDASDVGVVVYPSNGRLPQASKITNNQILNAGNDAFGGIVADAFSVKTQKDQLYPSCIDGAAPAPGTGNGDINCNYRGFTATGNLLWTGPNNHIIVAISAGNSMWGFFQPDSSDSIGGYFANNTSGSSLLRTSVPLYASGMHQAEFKDNFLGPNVQAVNARKCIGSATQLINPPRAVGLKNKSTVSSGPASSKLVSIKAGQSRDDCI